MKNFVIIRGIIIATALQYIISKSMDLRQLEKKTINLSILFNLSYSILRRNDFQKEADVLHGHIRIIDTHPFRKQLIADTQ